MLKMFKRSYILIAIIVSIPFGTASAVSIKSMKTGSIDLAVVFVHGFGGHFESSFETEDGTSWFDIIEEDVAELPNDRKVNQLNVFSVDYRDAFASEIGIDDIATQIAGRQEFDTLFQSHNHIWFVAHSLGGLVLKRVLLQLQGGGKEAYLNRILGVSLLGVPSQGAALAEFAQEHGWVARLLEYFFDDLEHSDKLVAELTTVSTGNSFLEQLEQDWLQLANRRVNSKYPFVIACAFETRPEIALVDLTIVPRLYSSTSCTDRNHPMNSAHRDLIKPRDAEDDIHNWFVRSVAKGLRLLARADVITWPSTRPFGSLVRMNEHQQDYIDGASGLQGTYEIVVVGDERLHNLSLAPGVYKGATFGYLIRDIGRSNRCIRITLDTIRRNVAVNFAREPVRCRGAGQQNAEYACRTEYCKNR